MAIAPPTDSAPRFRLAGIRGRLLRRESWPHAAALLLGFSLLATVGYADGGLFPRTWRLAAFALFAIAAAALLARERIVLARLDWAAPGTLGAFAGWIACSSAWGGNLSDAERALMYVAAVFAVLVFADRASVPQLLGGALGGITVVAGYGLWIYLFTSPALDPFEGSLLYQPLGYANALGIFVGIGVLLAVGLALAESRSAARAAWLAPLVVLVPALLLTSSRGAWVALLPGFAALALARGAVLERRLVVIASLLTVAVVTAVVFVTEDPTRFVTENRLRYWKVAWADYQDHPLLGSGSGTFGNYWLTHGAGPGFTRTAHSLYLQSLAELGPVGLLLVLLVVAVPFVALRWRRDPLVAVAAAGYTAYAVHAGIDWDWEIPAVTLAGLCCGASVLVATRPTGAGALTSTARIWLAGAALALTTFAALLLVTGGGLWFE